MKMNNFFFLNANGIGTIDYIVENFVLFAEIVRLNIRIFIFGIHAHSFKWCWCQLVCIFLAIAFLGFIKQSLKQMDFYSFQSILQIF